MPFQADRFLEARRWTVAGTFALALLVFLTVRPLMEPMDFRAFYCAGEAIKQHANPYREEPERSCQRRVLAASGLRLDERFVLPAPLPPYALILFAALAYLPYAGAIALWFSVNLLALTSSIVAVGKLANVSTVVVGFSLLVSAGYVSVVLGQLVPLVLAAAVFTALCARRGNGIGTAICATIVAIEPHLALPIWMSLCIFLPSARRPLAVAAGFIGLVSLSSGLALNLEYVRFVIPQHARSELLNFSGQYGVSSLLVALRMPLEVALAAGSACYAMMGIFGLAMGAALRRTSGDGAFLVLAPLASVVLGGPFLHITQTVVAIPLGFLLITLKPRCKMTIGCAIFAILMLAIPWQLMGRMSPVHVTGAQAVVASADVAHTIVPDESIELPYTESVDAAARRARTQDHFVETLALKIPTWLALIALLSAAARIAFRPGSGALRALRAA